ncbi:hypothetical protein D6D28_09952 [Aureobasidium pullulans]|uniref:EthD domain-containing protein n=2 Tax=Aureobasidium pullulans TaxID=5580 RepID=A0A4S8S0W2_AURPU|nr:hypothetical protein D6D28_09952 [Aureobasidium pullulans]
MVRQDAARTNGSAWKDDRIGGGAGQGDKSNDGQAFVLYPKGTNFNMDYYLSTHMPLAYKSWSDFGLKGWSVVEFGPDSDYCVQAILEWDSEESSKKALASEAAGVVMADVKNFSDKAPTFLSGKVVGSS